MAGDGKNYYKLDFGTSQSEEYFVCEPDRDDCLASLLDFDKWFYFCKESDSIVCDRTGLIKDIIEKHDTIVRKAMLMMPIIGIWWTGSRVTWELLKYVYGRLSPKNDSLEGMLTKLEIRKAVCRHPIEWDKNQFSKLKEKAVGKTVKTRLENEAAAIDLWNGGLDRIFSKNPYFYHPIYFINHLEKAGLFEFNPYAGKKYSEIYSRSSMPGIAGNNITESGDSVVVDNPGFAPVWIKGSWDDPNPNTNGNACVTGFFNEDYLDVMTGNGNTYKDNKYKVFTHEGVDFRGAEGTEIKSFIYGNVLAYGTFGFYGRTVFVSNKDNTGIFLLAHLKEYNNAVLDTGKVAPGDTVGKVGTSGPSDTEGNIDGKYPSHLHVSYFKIEKKYIKKFLAGQNGHSLKKGDEYSQGDIRNPFNYGSKKTNNEYGK